MPATVRVNEYEMHEGTSYNGGACAPGRPHGHRGILFGSSRIGETNAAPIVESSGRQLRPNASLQFFLSSARRTQLGVGKNDRHHQARLGLLSAGLAEEEKRHSTDDNSGTHSASRTICIYLPPVLASLCRGTSEKCCALETWQMEGAASQDTTYLTTKTCTHCSMPTAVRS